MARPVAVLDTTFLCVYLRVPGKDTFDYKKDHWDFKRVSSELNELSDSGYEFALPFAAIIETGNHIAHCDTTRYETATRLAQLIEEALQDTSIWSIQRHEALNSDDDIQSIVHQFPEAAARQLSMADLMILLLAQYYAACGLEVRVLSGDRQLSAWQPQGPILHSRRTVYGK
jgi:hypothetical protein